jgi:hypothetical protein
MKLVDDIIIYINGMAKLFTLPLENCLHFFCQNHAIEFEVNYYCLNEKN